MDLINSRNLPLQQLEENRIQAPIEVTNARLEVVFKKVKKRGFKGIKVTLEELPSHLSEQKEKQMKIEDIFLKKFAHNTIQIRIISRTFK